MNCNDCCYNLPRDGYSYCTYEDGECIKISMLEKENAELILGNKSLSEKLMNTTREKLDLQKENAELKELIKNIIRVTWGEGWNYSLDWKVKAEQFLK